MTSPAGSEAAAPTRIGLLLEPSPFTHLSGYTNRFDSLVGCLKAEGVEVVCAVPQHLPVRDALHTWATDHGAVPLIPLVGGQRLWFWFGFIPYNSPTWRLHSMLARRVGSAFNDLDVQLIHSTNPGFAIFGAVFWANFFDVPLVISYHTHALDYLNKYTGNTFRWSRSLARLIGRVTIRSSVAFADVVLCPSPELVHHLVEEVGCLPPERIQVWKKGVDADKFNPKHFDQKLRDKYLGGRFQYLMLFVGRLAPEKNLEELIPTIATVKDAVLVVVGEGPTHDESKLKSAFADHVEAGTVVFAGVLRGESLSRMFASADVFLMPSRTETLGFVVIEAMASGVPVVATRSGGIPSIIHDKLDSYLYPEGDVEEAVRLTKQLLDDPALRRKVGVAARAEAESLSWEASHAHVLRVQYVKAMQSHQAHKKSAGLMRSLVRRLFGSARRILLPRSTKLE